MAQGTATKVKKRKKSVLKRAAQSIQRAEVNRAHRTRVRSSMRSMRAAIVSGDSNAANSLLRATLSAIDRAVAKGVLTRNSANRYKSRLTVACQNLSAPKPKA
jgi:small subunit ribosomal protein S20